MRKKKVLLRDDDVADDLLETENLVVDLGQTTIIETSCGKRLSQSISEMSNWQLKVLLKENESRPDVNPREIAAMRAELQRRSGGTS